MTTGDPVVARVAMKPLPTLTKPLRSVDIETKAAGRRRCASAPTRARCPRREWWARRCSRWSSPRPAARSSAATACRTCWRPSSTTRADRMAEVEQQQLRPPAAKAGRSWSWSASWAPASRGPRASSRAGPGARHSTPTRCSRSGWASRSRASSTARARRRSASASASSCSSCSSGRGRRSCRSGAGRSSSEEVRSALREHTVVYVEVDAETAWDRASGTDRPLAQDRERFFELYARRVPLYEEVADVRLAWSDAGEGYPAFVGTGALDLAGTLWPRAGARVRGRGRARRGAPRRRPAARRCSERVEVAGSVGIPPGERSKTLAEAERVLRALAAAGMQRSDTVVALGGGVAGDLAGFCAATYQRGVPVVQVPTTVVAQVDSAYGGKTGVDLPEGKNYVGAFHQPAAVITDPRTARHASGSGAAGRLRRGPEDGPDRGRAPVGGRARHAAAAHGARHGSRAGDPGHRRLRPPQAERGRRGRARPRACGPRSTSATRSRTRSSRRPVTSATATARRWRSGLRVAMRLSERFAGLDPAVRRARCRSCSSATACRLSSKGPRRSVLLEHAGRDKKRRGDRRNLVLLRAPGEVEIGAEVPLAAFGRAIDEIRGAP